MRRLDHIKKLDDAFGQLIVNVHCKCGHHREMLPNWPKKLGVDSQLRNSFPALQTAAATFRAYVPIDKQGEFDKAWLLYYNAYKQDGTQSYHHYMNFSSSTVNTFGGISHTKQNGKENFKRNVDRLLAFAQDV
jgi:hypothetical protein